ncbi:MAG TPA: polysaccharide deacetylase family protein [Solirubrobacteraceae bacterium]|jgi:peptidoglycan/xylan/chitin deacetylase (PgdA/CDA1 family)
MTPRWSWDFEDEPPSGRAPRPLAPPAVPVSHEVDLAQIRRRRGSAAVILLLVVVLLVSALVGGSHHAHAKTPTTTATAGATKQHATQAPKVEESTAAGQAAVRSVFSYTPFVKAGGTRGHDVALTFDDGPGPYTPQVLDVLERFHVRATFFEIGKMLRYFSASTVREVADGDVIGDHTESHPAMAELSAHDQHEELFEQIARVEVLGAPRPDLFRPPYGSFDTTTMHVLYTMHLLMVLWSIDTQDYLQPGVGTIVKRALEGVGPGSIILMHDGGGDRAQTIAALPTIIRGLRARGLRLVTVPQLLIDDPPPAGQPLPPNLSGD